MASSYTLLGALQHFLTERKVQVDQLTADLAVMAMLDWYRLQPAGKWTSSAAGDALVYQYGGWSEGCATGYKFSVLRRITEKNDQGGETDWFAGITLMFEPSEAGDLPPYRTNTTEWKSIDAFYEAIQASGGFLKLQKRQPMSVMLESGGLR